MKGFSRDRLAPHDPTNFQDCLDPGAVSVKTARRLNAESTVLIELIIDMVKTLADGSVDACANIVSSTTIPIVRSGHMRRLIHKKIW
jgi:hypothetical protein